MEEVRNNQNIENVSFAVNKKKLLSALNFSNLIVEKRNVLKELHYIRLYTDRINLTIEATDLEIYLSQEIPLESVQQNGELIVHSQTLLDIVRKITDEKIHFSKQAENNFLEIKSGNSYFKLFIFEVSKFPKMLSLNETQLSEISLTTDNLASIINKTLFASSNEVTRYNLNGIFLHNIDDQLISVATDAHRLAISRCRFKEIKGKFETILSKKAAQDILKIIRDPCYTENIITIFLTANKMQCICKNFIFTSKIVEGIYPHYNDFIPKDEQNILRVNKKIFLEAVERISIISHHKFKSIKISIKKDSVVFSCFNDNTGSAKEEIFFSSNKEENFCKFLGLEENIFIYLNPEYLIDAIVPMSGDIISIYFINENSPIKIQDNKENQSVIMPLKN